MNYGLSLIDRASTKMGSDAKLARELGCSRAAISQIRSGKTRVSVEMGAELAVLVGDNLLGAIEHLMIENAKPEKASRLIAAFQRVVNPGAVATLLTFALSIPTDGVSRELHTVKQDLTVYTLSRFANAFGRWLRRLSKATLPTGFAL